MLLRATALVLASALALSACGAGATSLPATEAPPVASATSTASITPSPLPPTSTATLPPAPRTFTEEFDADAPYWKFLQAGAAGAATTAAMRPGTLRFELSEPDAWAYAVYADEVYEDVRIDAVVDFDGNGDSSAGVLCRYDAGVGWYEFNIYPDRTYNLLFGQWLAEGIARYTPLVVSESDEISPAVNEIGLVCQGDVLTPYVNSVQLRRRQETLHVLTEGQVGVSAASAAAGGQAVSFDWVSVGNP